MTATGRYAAGQAAAFLRARYDGPTIDVEPLSGGNWSTAFGFRHRSADLVARFGRHPDDDHAWNHDEVWLDRLTALVRADVAV